MREKRKKQIAEEIDRVIKREKDKDFNFTMTVSPRSSDPFYIVSYYIKWVTTSWTQLCVQTDLQTDKEIIKQRYGIKTFILNF